MSIQRRQGPLSKTQQTYYYAEIGRWAQPTWYRSLPDGELRFDHNPGLPDEDWRRQRWEWALDEEPLDQTAVMIRERRGLSIPRNRPFADAL